MGSDRRRLTNDDWGLESNCFVCESSNAAGMRLEFWANDERDIVEADLQLGSGYSGAPAVVHGGISLAVLDEVQAWAVIAFRGQFAVTVDTHSQFHLPVWIDHPHLLEGEVVDREGDLFHTRGRIIDGSGGICVTATAQFLSLGAATAASLDQQGETGSMRKFLRDD